MVTELLRGLQGRTELGFKSDIPSFRRLANHLLAIEATSLRDLAPDGLSRWVQAMRSTCIGILDRIENDPLTAWSSQRWSLHSLGHTGMLRFDQISQDWLREGTKRWVFDQLPRRLGEGQVLRDGVEHL